MVMVLSDRTSNLPTDVTFVFITTTELTLVMSRVLVIARLDDHSNVAVRPSETNLLQGRTNCLRCAKTAFPRGKHLSGHDHESASAASTACGNSHRVHSRGHVREPMRGHCADRPTVKVKQGDRARGIGPCCWSAR